MNLKFGAPPAFPPPYPLFWFLIGGKCSFVFFEEASGKI